jgi:hypothetical protein
MRNPKSKNNIISTTEHFLRWHELEFPFSKELLLDNSLNFNPTLYKSTEEDLHKILNFNKNGYRCDEFINQHSGKHVLFAGDSNTYGYGLLKEETWAYKLYKKLSEKSLLSGYFNIGEPGIGIPQTVFNIILYCEKYGKPDVIFLNLTVQSRLVKYDKRDKKYYNTFTSDENVEDHILYNYQYYFMLEKYCLANNIKLYSFSWQTITQPTLVAYLTDKKVNLDAPPTNEIFYNFNFDSFYKMNPKGLKKRVRENYNVEDPYFITARDDAHPGTGFHNVWCNFIYEIYLNDNPGS